MDRAFVSLIHTALCIEMFSTTVRITFSKRDIVLLNLSEPSHVVAFNPFRRAPDADVSVQVDRRIIATMHAWGVENSDLTPTLERTLRLIYTMLIEQGLSFQQAEHLIDFNARQIHEQLIQNVSSPLIRKEWQELQQLSPRDWRAEVLSAKNRLFRLLTSTALSRFFNPAGNAVDVADIVEKGKVLLVNLAASDHLSSENARVFGALLVNEFFEVAKRRDTSKDLKPFYLYLDEFQKFVSMDISAMLDEVRKFRMFTVLAHQRFGQLDEDLADAVLTNCRIKAVFGGLPVESAKMMAQELFIGELDPMKIKVAIYQTKFWPKYSRDKVYTRSSSTGRSAGRGDNQCSSSGAGSASGEFFLPGDWMTSGEMSGLSTSVSNMMTTVSASHTSETDFEGETEGVADVPILLPVPFTELSGLQYFSTDEQLTQLTAALKEQFPRHCFIKVHDQKTQPMLVPFVKHFHTSAKNLKWYEDKVLTSIHARNAADVDAEILDQQQHVERDEHRPAVRQAKANRKTSKAAWEDLLGRE
jgi:TraM recognition site of TraD and TraG